MAFTSGFTNDVFISYSHLDNTEDWVSIFHQRLQDRFNQITGGGQVTVWRDPKLNKLDVFSQEIFDQLAASAVLISIITPSSVRSSWCSDEREKFEQYAAGNGGFRLGNTLRAAVVVKTPLDRDAQRGMFPGLGFDFYIRDKATRLFTEFPLSSNPFTETLNELAQQVLELLGRMNERVPRRQRRGVYLALTADLNQQRQRIVNELSAWRVPVTPEAPISIDTPGFSAAVKAALDNCLLSVHFAGAHRGAIPDGEDEPVAVLQYELAQAQGLPQLVWVEPGAPAHPSFLAALQKGNLAGVEVLDRATQSIEDLKTLLKARIKGLEKEDRRLGKQDRRSVYLVCDGNDHPLMGARGNERAQQLKSYLDERGYTVWLPPVSVDEEKLREEDHKRTLEISDAVLLFWGAAGELWFRKRLRELTSVQIDRSHRPFLARALYLAEPPDGKEAYRHHLDLVIEQFGQFRAEDLAPFDEALQASR